MAAVAALRELSGVVVVAVDIAVVFVIAVLSAKDGGTEGAGEVVNVILALESCDIGPSQGSATLVAEQSQAPEIVGFAEGILPLAVLVIRREEL